MKTMRNFAICLLPVAFIACATWEGLSTGTQAVLKAGAKLALSYGLQELGDRVKEIRPWQDKLKGIIETTFSRALPPEEIGAALKKEVVRVVPVALRESVLAQFRESLAGSKTVAAAPEGNLDYNRRVAGRL